MKQTTDNKAWWRRYAAVNQDILVTITDETEIEKVRTAVSRKYKHLDVELDSDTFEMIVKSICEAWRR